ncbi:MAG: ABC transporter transmembrane domain-containing protein [Bacteroidia bacterium]|nr:ABC transporter transmembrane domain-containing protein [Bacteroidia bacterium]
MTHPFLPKSILLKSGSLNKVHPQIKAYLITFLKRNFPVFTVILGLSLISQILAVVLPISIGKFLSLLLPYKPYRAQIFSGLPESITNHAPRFLILFACLVLLKVLLDWVKYYQSEKLTSRSIFGLQEILFRVQLRLPIGLYEEKGTGKYLLRWSGDLQSVKSLISKGIIQFLGDLFFLSLLFAWIGWNFPMLAFDLLAMALMIAIHISLSCLTLYWSSTHKRNAKSSLIKFTSERLHNVSMIQALNRQIPEQKRFHKRLENALNKHLKHQFLNGLLRSISTGIYFIVVLWFMLRSLQLAESVEMELLPLFFLLISSSSPIKRLSKAGIFWVNGWISLSKLNKIIPENTSTSGKVSYQYQEGKLEVNFEGEKPGQLDSLKFQGNGIFYFPKIKEMNERFILQLLLAQRQHEAVKISWDEQDTQALEGTSLRKKITVVSVNHALMGRNVFEAISYSRKASKKKKAQAMLDLLQEELPPKERLRLDSKIGEYGSLLSPGQKQLLRFARAFLSRKPILLIHEPNGLIEEKWTPKVREQIQTLSQKAKLIVFQAHPTSF